MINVSIHDSDFVGDVLAGRKSPKPFTGEAVSLFWSGGVDSTYMLCWLIAHGYEVHTIYCHLGNNKRKSRRESWARGKIMDYLKMMGLDRHVRHNTTALYSVDVHYGNFRPVLAQAPLWLLGTLFKGQHNGLPTTYIISYVNGDDALYWIPAMRKVLDGYRGFDDTGASPVNVLFPMTSIKKSWFYSALKPLHGKMTWCEMAVLTKNCECPACKRHRFELGGM